VQNSTYERQQKISKVLLEEAGGEETDFDSEAELTQAEDEKFKLTPKESSKIFKYLKMPQGNISLPPMRTKGDKPLTLYLELDDVFLHTFLCDENFGYMANPASKDPEHEFFLVESKTPVLVYLRDHMQEFIDYLKTARKDGVETVLYTTGQKVYVDKLLEIVDPRRELFQHFLY
jgi:TFIIF-interacting CTD phosphatase-like protein